MVSMTVFGKTLRTQKINNEVFDYDFEEHFYFSGIDKVKNKKNKTLKKIIFRLLKS